MAKNPYNLVFEKIRQEINFSSKMNMAPAAVRS
jgi:hypothetical protein